MSTLTPTAPDDIQLVDQAGDDDALDAQIAALQSGGISFMETLQIALKSLTANKLRTLLTALGIIIGVASVVALMAIGQGSQASITASITANGANLLTVRSGASNTGGVRSAVGGAQTLTTDDAKALADTQNVPDASLVSPEYNGNGQLVAGSQNTNAQVVGVEPAYLAVHNISVAEGDFITDDQVSSMANVAVLGANVATTLFPRWRCTWAVAADQRAELQGRWYPGGERRQRLRIERRRCDCAACYGATQTVRRARSQRRRHPGVERRRAGPRRNQRDRCAR